MGQNLPQALRGQAVSALNPLLSNNQTRIRLDAAEALVNIGESSPEIAGILTSSLRDESSFTRSRAANALSNIRQGIPQAAVPTLISLLSDRNDFVRADAARALGNIRQELPQTLRDQAVTALSPLIGDANVPGAVVTRALGNLAQGSSQPVRDQTITTLIGALGHPEQPVQTAAANALVNMGQAAVPQLIQQFGNTSSLTIGSILSRISEGSIPDLTEALSHRDFRVRANAAMTLGQIINNGARVNPETLNRIVTEITNIATQAQRHGTTSGDNTDSRIAAVQALGLFGPQAQSAVPALTVIANNNQLHQNIRRAANDALSRINQE